MPATEEALKWWDEEMKKPSNQPRVDAEERMFRGTPMAADAEATPLNDPLWLDDAELNERQHIQKQVQRYEDTAAITPCGF